MSERHFKGGKRRTVTWGALVVAAVMLTTAASAGTVPLTNDPVGVAGGLLAAEEPASATAPAEPVDLAVGVHGDPAGEWSVVAEGRVHMPAPDGVLTVRRVDAGPGAQSVVARPVPLPEDGDAFRETVAMPPVAGDAAFEVRFTHDGAPAYFLTRAFAVTVHRGTVDVTPVTVTGDDGAGDPSVPGEAPPLPGTPDADDSTAGGDDGLTAMASATVTGRAYFKNPSGSYYYCRYCKIQLWDYDDGGSGDDYLGYAYADAAGYFSKYLSSNSDTNGGSGTHDVFIKIWSDSDNRGRVITTGGSYYAQRTGVLLWNIGSGEVALGRIDVDTSGNWAKAFWIHYSQVWSWHRINGDGFNVGEVTTRFPVDGWNGHTSGTAHYHPGGEIHLGSTQTSRDTHVHEHGHYTMYKGYNNNWFDTNCPSPHYMTKDSSQNCAWSEGWANYQALRVWLDSVYTWSSGSSIDLEVKFSGDSGDDVEGRVAATLWDIIDGANDGYDTINYVDYAPWRAFRHDSGVETTFRAYYDDWSAIYSASNFKLAAKQNTIIY